jgi:hypothetical protein
MADEQPSLPTIERNYADIRVGLTDGRSRAAAVSKEVIEFLYGVVTDSGGYGHDMSDRIQAAGEILNFIKVP